MSTARNRKDSRIRIFWYCPLTAPAVANAIYAACGARLRAVPFTPARVLAALAAQRQG